MSGRALLLQKLFYWTAVLFTVLLVIGVLVASVIPRTETTSVDVAKFAPSKASDTWLVRMPRSLQKWANREAPFILQQEDRIFKAATSVTALSGLAEPAFHVSPKGGLYINQALHQIVQTSAPALEIGVDVKATVERASRFLLPAVVLLGLFWFLGHFIPASSSLQATSTTTRLPALDSLRGIAALIVVFTHAASSFYPTFWSFIDFENGVLVKTPLIMEWLKITPLQILLNGELMVIIFWILSGYVLSAPILAKQSYPKLAQAAVKRYFRLVPLAAVSVLASYLFIITDAYSLKSFIKAAGHTVPALMTYFQQEPTSAFVLKEAFGFGLEFNMPLWTILLEFQGSLLLFAVIGCSMPLKNRRLVWLAVIVCLIVMKKYFFADFIIGMFLADYSLTRKQQGKPATFISGKWACIILVASLIAASAYPGWVNLITETSRGLRQPWVLHPTAIALVVLAAFSAPVIRMLSARWLVWLGERSFALYVVHTLMIYLVGHAVAVFFINSGMSVTLAASIGVGAYLLAALIASDVLLRLVDQPSMVLANKIGQWFQGNSSVEPKTPMAADSATATPAVK